jgi:hypothetical protein
MADNNGSLQSSVLTWHVVICYLQVVTCKYFRPADYLFLLLHETRLSYTVFKASLSTGIKKKFGQISRRKLVEIVVVACTNGRTVINLRFVEHNFDIP